MKRLFLILLFCIAGLAWVSVFKRHSADVRRADFPEFRVEAPREEEPPRIEDLVPNPDRGSQNPTNLFQRSAPAERRVRKPDNGTNQPSPVNSDLFASSIVPRIQIEISRSGINALGSTHWGNGQERPTVRATVREGNTVFTNVAVHLKGAAGSFRHINQNPCFTLNFDKLAPGQRFHGLQKLSLNNSVQDPSYLSEKICRELFQAAGVPVPRAGHARVSLNGRDLGLYVLTEGYNKQFLKRHFQNAKGNLYDGGFCREITDRITDRLSINSGDNPEDHSGLRALIAATRITNATQRLARLEQVLDMDRFYSFLAMDLMLCNWDGYALNRNNWRLFHDLESNKMVFLPHGLDQMFGYPRDRGDPTTYRLVRPMQGLVAEVVMNTREGKRRYLEKVGQLYTNVFHVETILKRVDQMAAVIGQNNGRADDLKRRIRLRDQSLKQQLAAFSTPQAISTDGTTKLTGWQPRVQSGSPHFRQQREPNGAVALNITAADASTTGSWRTSVMLDEGRYRFEGKIRTKDVKTSSGNAGGAELRISRGNIPQGLSGTSEWRNFAYPFQVPEGGMDVELVCELRASKGEVWFDTSSLRIIRVQ